MKNDAQQQILVLSVGIALGGMALGLGLLEFPRFMRDLAMQAQHEAMRTGQPLPWPLNAIAPGTILWFAVGIVITMILTVIWRAWHYFWHLDTPPAPKDTP